MKIFYIAEDTVNFDPFFEGTLEECINELKKKGYKVGEARICKYEDDGDPICTEITTEW